MRSSSSRNQILYGKTLSLQDLQTKAKPYGLDSFGRARSLSKLTCKYCPAKTRMLGSHFVCEKCKIFKDAENAVNVVLEREKRLRLKRFGGNSLTSI